MLADADDSNSKADRLFGEGMELWWIGQRAGACRLYLPRIVWLKTTSQRRDFLSPHEGHRLLQDRTEPLWSDMARLALRTGMRRGELMALDWSDIDLTRARLTVSRSLVDGVMNAPKNGRIRHLPLTPDVVAMLRARLRHTGLVFTRADGSPLGKSITSGGIFRLCRRAGLRPVGWHTLRHTFASNLAAEGVPLTVVKDLMGHASITMTMRYAHLAPSSLSDAVAVLLRAEEREIAEDGQRVGSETRREPTRVQLKIPQRSLFSDIGLRLL